MLLTDMEHFEQQRGGAYSSSSNNGNSRELALLASSLGDTPGSISRLLGSGGGGVGVGGGSQGKGSVKRLVSIYHISAFFFLVCVCFFFL